MRLENGDQTRLPLTPKQARVFEVIAHYYEHIGEPASPSYIARKSNITRPKVYVYLNILHTKGWLTEHALAIPRIRISPERHQ